MTPEEMRTIRLAAGLNTPKALGAEVDRSERWVHYRESGHTPIDRLEAHALKNIEREAWEKKKKKKCKICVD